MTAPALPVWSGATARPYAREACAVRDTLAGQVAAPVRFVEQIEDMYAAGVRTFVEAGPGRVLTGLVGQILAGRPHTALALDVPGESGLARLPHVLARLAAAGVPVDPEGLFRGRAQPLPASAPRRPGWLVNGHTVRTADGAFLPGGLRPARRVESRPGDSGAARADGGAAPGEDARQAAVLEYLRATRELVAAQRDVVLRYLGEGARLLGSPSPMRSPSPLRPRRPRQSGPFSSRRIPNPPVPVPEPGPTPPSRSRPPPGHGS